MSHITLIRHGQANTGARDEQSYDRLSALGHQQAAWLGEVTRLARSSGVIRLLIVWNVDATYFGDDPQSGYAIVRPGNHCPSCDTLRAAMGG